jgi:hypothetical protein
MSKKSRRGHAAGSIPTRWQKGQTGNPKRQYSPRAPKTAMEILIQCFAETIKIVENGKTRRVSTFEAIYLQLLQKDAAGQKRAMRIRMQYELLAIEHAGEPEFIIKNIPHEGPEDIPQSRDKEEKDDDK